MQAIRVHETGGPEVMVLDQLEPPEPAAGQVLIRVEAAGVNYIDVYLRTGQYPAPTPMTLGLEGAGEVVAMGAGAGADIAIGDRVAWTGVLGSYASHVVAPADRVVPIPDNVSSQQAAAVMLQGLTAHYLSHSTHALGPGQSCLVHAAAGGVGLLLCQMAKRRGARVIGTVSTPAKAEAARAHGADEVILYTETDFATEVARITERAGVDVVYDSVGKTTFDRGLDCLAPRGTMVLFGQSSGPVAPFDPQILNRKGSLFLTRPSLFHYTASRDELMARAGDVLGWVASGQLSVTIDSILPLAQAARAHTLLESRNTVGKLLLSPAESHEPGSKQGGLTS